jgi:Uma2 family endonuclease
MLTSPLVKDNFSLEDFMANPPDRMEWVDGQLVEKSGITLRHGEIQFRLACYWDNYKESSEQGGENLHGCALSY